MKKMNKISFTIPVAPITKKNSGQIIINPKTGHPIIIPSKQYQRYKEEASWFVKPLQIDKPINVKALYFMKTRRNVDLSNLHEGLHDLLVDCEMLADDNCHIIVSTDGSRVLYDKDNPRTEVEITFLENFHDPLKKK